jgi:hypothetical protein
MSALEPPHVYEVASKTIPVGFAIGLWVCNVEPLKVSGTGNRMHDLRILVRPRRMIPIDGVNRVHADPQWRRKLTWTMVRLRVSNRAAKLVAEWLCKRFRLLRSYRSEIPLDGRADREWGAAAFPLPPREPDFHTAHPKPNLRRRRRTLRNTGAAQCRAAVAR